MKNQEFYKEKLTQETDYIKKVGWENKKKALKRYKAISEKIGSGDKTIVDYGCGIGNFSNFLPRSIFYIGIDCYEDYIETAKRIHPEKSFGVTKGDGIIPLCDDVVLIGVWTLRDDKTDDEFWDEIINQLVNMLPYVGGSIIINGFHNQVSYKDQKLFYHDLCKWVKYCNLLRVDCEFQIFEEHEFILTVKKK
jgi:hypothetical protein